MAQLMRCKPCGYIISEDKLGDTCPACGVPSKVFEPYKDRVSPERRKILDLDLHPIAVHFPQTLAVFIAQIVLVNLIFPEFKPTEIKSFVQFMALLLPFAVVGAFLSGIIDGKARFKKLKTTALTRKIIFGSMMIISSGLVTLFSFNMPDGALEYNTIQKIIILLSSSVTLAIAIYLAVIGKKLMYAEMPG
ncbi:MAG: rubrerythrin [Bacteroidales bacterium]|nr:rubrerythrin [Bacteroidales bacterium]